MNRTVVVEQEYNPDIMDASKVNVLPKVEEPTVSRKMWNTPRHSFRRPPFQQV